MYLDIHCEMLLGAIDGDWGRKGKMEKHELDSGVARDLGYFSAD